ncbi:cation chloride cotransporter [Drechmeria coniospora]|uniref:Cation chloride cotransporter n=1 Tax=Drechmeria coniospora TaxID=98403 RepID=A0A151GWZ4_DRECN|nr:cation chloride cotransporter [Drechmeria coniospora]KYK61624.1 cation chloride cotransporter [Drechmeria coniospora]
MPTSPSPDGNGAAEHRKSAKLGLMSGVYIPVFLNITSILMFLRFGLVLGQVGFVGIMGLLVTAYCVDLLTTLSLSAIASNGEVKGGGAYYLISRSLGPEFGGSIGILFFLAQSLNTALNIVGLVDCIRLYLGPSFPRGYWAGYGLQTIALTLCTGLCLLGSATFSRASNALLAILTLAVVSIPLSAMFKQPFRDERTGIEFTGLSLNTLARNFLPRTDNTGYNGLATFRDLFGILFPATAGIFAGASMSGDLKNPSKAIPTGTLWAMVTTFIVYFVVVLSLAATTTHESFLANANIIPLINLSAPVILAGECAVTLFSALMGIIGSAKLFQALAKDQLLPGLSVFSKGTKKYDEPVLAIMLTYVISQISLLADLNHIATFISMGYQMTFFVMNLACFLLKIGSAPNFRPGFKYFSWQTAFLGSLLSAAAMFFIDETYASVAICGLIFLFLLIHYLCPPKRWGDVSQNLLYHQVRKYLLRLKPEHIKFWRPHIILLINDPRRQVNLIQFCNSMKKGSLYILGHVIVTDDFDSGVHEARLQQQAWTNYISEFSRIKAFVQLTMSPSITWGIRNLILSAGLGGMRPNIAVMGFYNMNELRKSNPRVTIPEVPASPAVKMRRPPEADVRAPATKRRRDTSARLLEGVLPTDVIRTEGMMSPTDYMVMLEDLALKYRLNVAVAHGFEKLERPRRDGGNSKRFVDLWPIQMSAEVLSDGKNILTTNFDTYTLILQLGHILESVHTWKQAYSLRVMLFVEYENEVEDESARVRALLEKLRIEAKVLVFWLASGHLNTYEFIINGFTDDIDTEIIVNDALKGEKWWEELQAFREQVNSLSSSRDMGQMAHFLDSTIGRPGVYNPHEEGTVRRRRSSMAEVADMLKKPAMGSLAKMGVNMGIHTHHLSEGVLQDESSEEEWHSEADTTDTESEETLMRKMQQGGLCWEIVDRIESHRDELDEGSGRKTSASLKFWRLVPAPKKKATRMRAQCWKPFRPSVHLTSLPSLALHQLGQGLTPIRPSFSRQSSVARFSSRLVPEATITSEAEGSNISFAPSMPPTPRTERPTHSRQSSLGRFSSRPVPETKVGGENEGPRTIQFVEQPMTGSTSASHSRHHSRECSSTIGQGDGVALSFNDLPSRAQHLILNDLMRQHSKDTAVLMTTLPIPSDGTSLEELATIQYLSDVEVLCNELPPTLMVLSNNMTVTLQTKGARFGKKVHQSCNMSQVVMTQHAERLGYPPVGPRRLKMAAAKSGLVEQQYKLLITVSRKPEEGTSTTAEEHGAKALGQPSTRPPPLLLNDERRERFYMHCWTVPSTIPNHNESIAGYDQYHRQTKLRSRSVTDQIQSDDPVLEPARTSDSPKGPYERSSTAIGVDGFCHNCGLDITGISLPALHGGSTGVPAARFCGSCSLDATGASLPASPTFTDEFHVPQTSLYQDGVAHARSTWTSCISDESLPSNYPDEPHSPGRLAPSPRSLLSVSQRRSSLHQNTCTTFPSDMSRSDASFGVPSPISAWQDSATSPVPVRRDPMEPSFNAQQVPYHTPLLSDKGLRIMHRRSSIIPIRIRDRALLPVREYSSRCSVDIGCSTLGRMKRAKVVDIRCEKLSNREAKKCQQRVCHGAVGWI